MATETDTLVELVWLGFENKTFVNEKTREDIKNPISIGNPRLITYLSDHRSKGRSTDPDEILAAIKDKAPKDANAYCRAGLTDGIAVSEEPGKMSMCEPIQFYRIPE
jgi:hypothetical protein